MIDLLIANEGGTILYSTKKMKQEYGEDQNILAFLLPAIIPYIKKVDFKHLKNKKYNQIILKNIQFNLNTERKLIIKDLNEEYTFNYFKYQKHNFHGLTMSKTNISEKILRNMFKQMSDLVEILNINTPSGVLHTQKKTKRLNRLFDTIKTQKSQQKNYFI